MHHTIGVKSSTCQYFHQNAQQVFLQFSVKYIVKKGVDFMARRGENIYKRKDGRYEGRYIKYYDMSGKAVYGYVYSRSYAEIKELLAKYRTEKPTKQGKNTTLSEWLNCWLKSQVTLKPTTKRIYKSHIDNYINPNLGKIPLKKMNGDILLIASSTSFTEKQTLYKKFSMLFKNVSLL